MVGKCLAKGLAPGEPIAHQGVVIGGVMAPQRCSRVNLQEPVDVWFS